MYEVCVGAKAPQFVSVNHFPKEKNSEGCVAYQPITVCHACLFFIIVLLKQGLAVLIRTLRNNLHCHTVLVVKKKKP